MTSGARWCQTRFDIFLYSIILYNIKWCEISEKMKTKNRLERETATAVCERRNFINPWTLLGGQTPPSSKKGSGNYWRGSHLIYRNKPSRRLGRGAILLLLLVRFPSRRRRDESLPPTRVVLSSSRLAENHLGSDGARSGLFEIDRVSFNGEMADGSPPFTIYDFSFSPFLNR